jgi:phage tail-like protein
MLDDDYPPVAFSFKVVFAATAGKFDTSFQEVSGMKATIGTEPYPELGENGFVHQLPKPVTYDPLVLKRGIASMTSPLVLWCRSIFESEGRIPIVPMPIMVYLMDEEKIPKRAWALTGAFPVSWDVGSFNAEESKVAIETIELRYNYLTRML